MASLQAEKGASVATKLFTFLCIFLVVQCHSAASDYMTISKNTLFYGLTTPTSVPVCATSQLQGQATSVTSRMLCSQKCLQHQSSCIGFNYRNKEPAQQLSVCELFFEKPTSWCLVPACIYYQTNASSTVSDLDECSSSPCLNGATCIAANNAYTCNCVPGYIGPDCSTNVDDCYNPVGGSFCPSECTCVDGVNSYTCHCPTAVALAVSTGTVITTSFTEPGPQNTISMNKNTYTTPGNAGSTSENKVNSPAAAQTVGTTSSGGINSPAANTGSTSAAGGISSGMTGLVGSAAVTKDSITTLLASATTKPSSACASNPCANGGTCVDGGANYTCICPPGLTGRTCSSDGTDYCSQQPVPPCKNGGTCNNGIGSYYCDCVPGFTGADCQTNIDECLSQPCQNNGTCVDGANGYTCNCQPGVVGSNCQTGSPIRLINTKNPAETYIGRVEIYHDNEWGSVSSYLVVDNTAAVLCKGLHQGYTDGLPLSSVGGGYGPGSGQIWLAGLVCVGSEDVIENCPHSTWGYAGPFSHDDDLAVWCSTTKIVINYRITPSNGPFPPPMQSTGLLEVQFNNVWGSVCFSSFTPNSATVACTSLGYPAGGSQTEAKTSGFPTSAGPSWLGTFGCSNTEASIDKCPHGLWARSGCDGSTDSVALTCTPVSG